METKVIVIRQDKDPASLVKIEFKRLLCTGLIMERDSTNPANYNFIELIALDYVDGYDLMFAYDDASRRNEGLLFVGHFNDGIV